MIDKKQTFKEVFSEMVELGKTIFGENKNQKFADYKAEDGTVVRTEDTEIKAGSKLQVITPEGIVDVPAEVSEMVLMINDVPTKVTIEAGIVKELAPVEQAPAEEAPAEEMSQFDAEASHNGLVERITKLENALGIANQTIETANQTIASANTQINAQNDLNKKLFSLIEKLADAPAVEPLSESKDKQRFKADHGNDLEEFRKKHNL